MLKTTPKQNPKCIEHKDSLVQYWKNNFYKAQANVPRMYIFKTEWETYCELSDTIPISALRCPYKLMIKIKKVNDNTELVHKLFKMNKQKIFNFISKNYRNQRVKYAKLNRNQFFDSRNIERLQTYKKLKENLEKLQNFEDKYDADEYQNVVEESSSIIDNLCSVWVYFF